MTREGGTNRPIDARGMYGRGGGAETPATKCRGSARRSGGLPAGAQRQWGSHIRRASRAGAGHRLTLGGGAGGVRRR
jgi:hypothetical protein